MRRRHLSQATLDWYAGNGFHPTFFYEAGWSILMFGLLYLIYREFGHKLRDGDGALLYFIAYPLGRFWVEIFRPDAWVIGELAAAQWIAIISVAVSVVIFILRHNGWSAQDHQDESLAVLSRHKARQRALAEAGKAASILSRWKAAFPVLRIA